MEWLTSSITHLALAAAGLIVGVPVILFLANKFLQMIRPLIVIFLVRSLGSLAKADEDRALVIALIHWAEIKFKHLSGSERKMKVIEKVRKYMPAYTQPAAAELVQLCFDEVSIILKKTASDLQSN